MICTLILLALFGLMLWAYNAIKNSDDDNDDDDDDSYGGGSLIGGLIDGFEGAYT